MRNNLTRVTSVSLGMGCGFICSHTPERAGMTDAFLWVTDVDLLHAEVSARGAIVPLPPTDQSWGTRETGIPNQMEMCSFSRQDYNLTTQSIESIEMTTYYDAFGAN